MRIQRCPTHNIGAWPARRAEMAGDAVTVVEPECRLTYAEFEGRVRRCAGWLAERGTLPGERIGILLSNRSAYLELVFAAARLGAIAVPINTRFAPPEIHQILSDCTPHLLVHEVELADGAARACEGLPVPQCIPIGEGVDAYEAGLAGAQPLSHVAAVAPDDPALLMYTSGSTGIPKGALLPHRKVLFNCLNAQLFFDLTARDRILVVLPMFHSFGLQILALPTFYVGGSIYFQQRFEPEAVWQLVSDAKLTFFGGVPTMFRALYDALVQNSGAYDLRALRFLFTAGAPIPVEIIESYEKLGLRLKQGFGQTETSILCCLDARDAVRKAGSVGKPVFHAELRLVTPHSVAGPLDGWRDAAAGEVGEISVRGPIVMSGYWKRPERNAETLREEGWLRTGDLATRDAEGFISLVGRSHEMYISGGENVYPAEVEAVYATHPDIREIAVVGIPDAQWGEVGRAYVVLQPGSVLDGEAMRAWGSERLARFKLPREFVAVAELPRTVSGKVQKHRLLEEI